MSKISVIIVSWNARGYLRDCLASIRETGGGLVKEVIVVDNASTDGSPDMVAEQFSETTLIRSGENLGFARGNNLGIKRASGTILALINSDVVVHPGCFQKLAAFLDSNPKVALAGPKVIGRDGRPQLTCGRLPTVWNTVCQFLALGRIFPRWRWFDGFEMRHWDPDRPANVEVLSGCFWLARGEAVKEVGGLDERFFFYAEDVDWCKRFGDAGWKIAFAPEATATHFGGGSSGNAPLRYSIEILRANLLYWKKHHGSLGRGAYYVLALTWHSLRFAVRALLKLVGMAKGDETQLRLKEHLACVRWLLTGRGV